MQKLTNLKRVLFEDSISQRQISKKTGIPESFISMALSGRLNLTDTEMRKIAECLGRPKEVLFN